MRIHLLVNTHRGDAVDAARQTASWLSGRGAQVAVDAEAARFIEEPSFTDESAAEADLFVCFGGDGTLMRAANLCSEKSVPILGVYFGRFGFVTQCRAEDLQSCLEGILDGELKTEDRMMLETVLLREGHAISDVHALNEVALQRAITARMMTFQVAIDGETVTSYPADGVLVATATGSTAYNLSAGGPIMDPKVNAIILTAINPHTLSARPLVLKFDSEIHLDVQTEGDAVLSADGQTRMHLLSGDEVRIRRSPRVTRLVTVDKHDFLAKLRDRLLWARVADRGGL